METKEISHPRARPERLAAFCTDVLTAIGVEAASADAASRAMMHGSIHGVDSHGVRLLGHYFRAFEGGRLNKAPKLKPNRVRSGTALLDADHAHGAYAAYAATDLACDMAAEAGIAAVGIQNSSHFGPAGAYTTHAARRGMLAMSFCNSDSFVRLHDGAERFHGTNPISVAVPTGGRNPWLLDMATSAVPFNRVLLYRSLGVALPPGVASDGNGLDTTDPHAAEMLAPVGHEFGFKGAALGGISEIFSAILTGMRLSPEILPMNGEDFETPRELGAFVIVMDPDGFIGGEMVRAGMERYLNLLRTSKPQTGKKVLAPGDREWAEAERRRVEGIPLDPATQEDFLQLAAQTGLSAPFE
jgi:LDH2 family malate/lactate/ureidoglycolate dehydrogenase